jgi:hypothetical protein
MQGEADMNAIVANDRENPDALLQGSFERALTLFTECYTRARELDFCITRINDMACGPESFARDLNAVVVWVYPKVQLPEPD